MTIAPNGVAIADYDASGIGAIVFAGINKAASGWGDVSVTFGEDVVAANAQLKPACIMDYSLDGTDQVVTTVGDVLPGTWRCLGYLHLADANVSESATLFMRVA